MLACPWRWLLKDTTTPMTRPEKHLFKLQHTTTPMTRPEKHLFKLQHTTTPMTRPEKHLFKLQQRQKGGACHPPTPSSPGCRTDTWYQHRHHDDAVNPRSQLALTCLSSDKTATIHSPCISQRRTSTPFGEVRGEKVK